MELMLDTANLERIRSLEPVLPFVGVTSNPSILKSEGRVDFFDHMRQIRSIIGSHRSLHIQVISRDASGMVAEADCLLRKIDRDVYVKIPVTEAGLQAMKELKAQGVRVTATAIYTKMQGLWAIAAGADYIAPYCDRMQNMDVDPWDVIGFLAQVIHEQQASTRILAASFKNVGQVTDALAAGAHSVTLPQDLLTASLQLPAIDGAVAAFQKDWETLYGEGTTLLDI